MNHFHDPGRSAVQHNPDILKFTDFKPRTEKPKSVTSHQEQYRVNGVGYASGSEAACALLMERYIPFFRVIPGKTYQVEIGKSERGDACHADFQIFGRTIFEFHPPRFWIKGRRLGEFSSYEERIEYYRRFNESRGAERKQIKQAMLERLALNYYLKRRALLDRSEEHKHKDLIVACDAHDFYHKVIKQFGENIPSEKSFIAQFEGLRRNICKRMKIIKPDPDRGPGPGSASLDRRKAA